ncbi:recombinase family protein [Oscillospiraceae bacterium 38-13]
MAGNRKLPFGYRMERGEITKHPVEAEAVRKIFQRYLAGASYAALVERLRDAGPAYDGDKPWNKNMVARILENAKYTGDTGFPAVISREAFQKVQAQRKELPQRLRRKRSSAVSAAETRPNMWRGRC